MPSEKTLKRIVIILGILLVVGFFTLVSIIIYRAVHMDDERKAQSSTTIHPNSASGVQHLEGLSDFKLSVPEGTSVISSSSDGKILIIHLKTPEEQVRIVVFDLVEKVVIGDMVLTTRP